MPLAIAAPGVLLMISAACSSGPASPLAESVQAASPVQVWVDPATHLTWAAKDNGYDVTGEMARTFCSNLTTGGFKWVLPTIDQIESVYWVGENDYGHPIKGNIELTGNYLWSSSANGSGSAWGFNFLNGERFSNATAYYDANRALCVRRAGE